MQDLLCKDKMAVVKPYKPYDLPGGFWVLGFMGLGLRQVGDTRALANTYPENPSRPNKHL